MKPVTTIDQARRLIESYRGRPEDFELPIANEMLDPMGVNMAIITDAILAREWEPDGFTESTGYRTCRYKAMGGGS